MILVEGSKVISEGWARNRKPMDVEDHQAKDAIGVGAIDYLSIARDALSTLSRKTCHRGELAWYKRGP